MTSFNPRQTCLWIHRYTGLAMAAFLMVAGLSGALLAFHDELDDVFNQRLAYVDDQKMSQLSIATLHDKAVSAYPKYKFSSMPLSIEPDKSAEFMVDRLREKEAKNQPKADFQEVYINPYTGDIIGTRDKEVWAWRNTMEKVFWLHRELLLGDIGKLILGIVALVWTINCFIGFYLTLPRAVKNRKDKRNKVKDKHSTKKRTSFFKRWLPAWKIRTKTKTNTFKLNYDLHHAFGLWLWLMLFIIAWSSVGFNLKEIYQPVMQAVVGLEGKDDKSKDKAQQGDKDDIKTEQQNISGNTLIADNIINDVDNRITKANSIAYLSEQANIAARENDVAIEKLLGMRWIAEDNQWQLRFITNKDIGKKGGASSITVDAVTGNVEKLKFGYESSFGSKTDQWLATLHMGHISLGQKEQLGHLLYQLFLVVIGLAVTTLSGTGAYLWYKGHQSRLKQRRKVNLKNDYEKLAVKNQL